MIFSKFLKTPIFVLSTLGLCLSLSASPFRNPGESFEDRLFRRSLPPIFGSRITGGGGFRSMKTFINANANSSRDNRLFFAGNRDVPTPKLFGCEEFRQVSLKGVERLKMLEATGWEFLSVSDPENLAEKLEKAHSMLLDFCSAEGKWYSNKSFVSSSTPSFSWEYPDRWAQNSLERWMEVVEPKWIEPQEEGDGVNLVAHRLVSEVIGSHEILSSPALNVEETDFYPASGELLAFAGFLDSPEDFESQRERHFQNFVQKLESILAEDFVSEDLFTKHSSFIDSYIELLEVLRLTSQKDSGVESSIQSKKSVLRRLQKSAESAVSSKSI